MYAARTGRAILGESPTTQACSQRRSKGPQGKSRAFRPSLTEHPHQQEKTPKMAKKASRPRRTAIATMPPCGCCLRRADRPFFVESRQPPAAVGVVVVVERAGRWEGTWWWSWGRIWQVLGCSRAWTGRGLRGCVCNLLLARTLLEQATSDILPEIPATRGRGRKSELLIEVFFITLVSGFRHTTLPDDVIHGNCTPEKNV